MYVLLCSDRSLYCGITTNIRRRLSEHNSSTKGAKYTRSRRPVRLIYYENHQDRSEASKAEYAFKKLSRSKKVKYLTGLP